MTKKLIGAVGALAILLVFSACEQDVKVDTEFSVNIFHPGPKWPNVKKLTLPQKEVYERFGKPDCFRVWWSPAGELQSRDAAMAYYKEKKKVPQEYSWVYIARGVEVLFTGNSFQEQKISDQVRVVAKYGDPEDVKQMQQGVTQWMYYSAGKLYKFAEGSLMEEKEFPAMGKFPRM